MLNIIGGIFLLLIMLAVAIGFVTAVGNIAGAIEQFPQSEDIDIVIDLTSEDEEDGIAD
jgi:hypothetical protein